MYITKKKKYKLIYVYYNREIHTAEVSETKKMYRTLRPTGVAFGCVRQFYKKDVALTPLEAIVKVLNVAMCELQSLKDRKKVIEAEVDIMWDLKKYYSL